MAVAIVMEGYSSPTIVELGSSQGLWCFPWVNVLSRKNIKNIVALGVEAADASLEVLDFWKLQGKQFVVKEFDDSLHLDGMGWNFKWMHRAVTTGVNEVLFPDVSVATNNGASIDNQMQHDVSRMIKVKVLSPQDILGQVNLLSGKSEIALLHLDLQGEELKLLETDQLAHLLGGTSIVVLGTHSTKSEVTALPYFHDKGFTLLSLEFSEYSKVSSERLVKDGEQIWISNFVFQKCIEKDWLQESQTLEVIASSLSDILEFKKRVNPALTSEENTETFPEALKVDTSNALRRFSKARGMFSWK